MAVNSRAVTVATTATRIDSAEAGEASAAAAVYNAGAATVYLGGPGVTTANGYPLAAGEHLGIDVKESAFYQAGTDALYGIVASGTVAVRVLEVGA